MAWLGRPHVEVLHLDALIALGLTLAPQQQRILGRHGCKQM